jgi:5-methylthioadenosine/S-adenosylhomocysteine deaminase
LFDSQGPNKLSFDEGLAYTRSLLQKYAHDPLVSVSVQPHATYTVSVENLVRARALADEFQAPYALHASETAREVADVRAQSGLTPPRLLHKYGLLGENVLLFHAVHLDDEEIALLAESGTSVVHCPDANLKLGSGIARLPALLKAGVNVGLGTDGPASNNDLNLWDEVQLAAKLHLGTAQDPTVVSARQAVYLATRGGAEALGMGDKVGSIQAGRRADLILLDFKQPHLLPVYDIYSHLAYAAGRGDVVTTIVSGTPLMVDRQLVTLDEPALLAQVQELGGVIQQWLVEQKKLYN